MLQAGQPQQVTRSVSDLSKARQEAESISYALRQAHRSAANLGALAQRSSAAPDAHVQGAGRRKSSVAKRGSVVDRLGTDKAQVEFGATVESRRSGSRSLVGEQKRTFLSFDTKADPAFRAGDRGDSDDESLANLDINKVTGDETEEDLSLKDLIFYLFDGFPRADLAGLFPNWYEASIWAERINFFFVMLSIVMIATETLPIYFNENLFLFSLVEIISITYFTMEMAVRIICTPNFGKFAKSFLNWVDFFSIIPFYVGIIVSAVSDGDSIILFRYFRLLRILRVLKLARRNVGLLAVSEALRESSEAITLLGFLMMIALLLFSSLMYYAEQYNATFNDRLNLWIREDGLPSPYQSIFHAMWWCIVTMTTVGYGDAVPITPFGKVVGGVTMLCGVFVLAFPTVILSTNFQEIHQSKVEGQLQMDQIYEAQREAARHRANERKRKRELQAQLEQEMQEIGDGGEVEDSTNHAQSGTLSARTGQATAVGGGGGDDRGAQPSMAPSQVPADLPTHFRFEFDPYHGIAKPAVAAITAFATLGGLFGGNEEEDRRTDHEIVIVGDSVALYNPIVHVVCHEGSVRAQVRQCLTRTVVTLWLAVESIECQEAAEEAVRRHRPDLFGKVLVLPRPITKLKVDTAIDHPLLHDLRLQCSTFVDPAGVIPISFVVPYPSLVTELLANLSSMKLLTWVFYEPPGMVDEPLFHYGGAILGGTDFDEEELDVHARKLISDPTASTEMAPVLRSGDDSLFLAQTNEFKAFQDTSVVSAPRIQQPHRSTVVAVQSPQHAAETGVDASAAFAAAQGRRRMSLDVSRGGNPSLQGGIRSPVAVSPVFGMSPVGK